MQIYRCEIYTTSAMHSAVLVAHVLAQDVMTAAVMVRKALAEFHVVLHLGGFTELASSPVQLSPAEAVKITRFSAGY